MPAAEAALVALSLEGERPASDWRVVEVQPLLEDVLKLPAGAGF